ncbi:hypothetical protein [Phenylobacterium kunshanense]|uniref:Uncharacterized protein n=1 Tax=Phenylobacterium kunshanense TaxID=1445034 RepID=A0A328BN54_9CAUL|nr:hypothetical protein [Phenylobacterium kunshanense]RAK68770.1 hypothetical protein DJ019_01805 [Phenylobacterium kunshanense]
MSPDAALAVLRRHLPSLEAAAMPTKCEVFTACGYEAAELRDAIEALSRRPDAPSADGWLPIETEGDDASQD